MGADGTFQIVKKEDWDKNCPNVSPSDCGLSTRTLVGVEIVCGYHDTEGRDWEEFGKQGLVDSLESHQARLKLVKEEGIDGIYRKTSRVPMLPTLRIEQATEEKAIAEILASPNLEYARKCAVAAKWFSDNAEDITVWT